MICQEEKLRFDAVKDIIIAPNGGPPSYPAHWHNAAEFILARQDGCRFRIQSLEYVLREGDLLLIWPNELHETVFLPPESVSFIQFSDQLLDNNLDLAITRRHFTRLTLVSHTEEPDLAEQLAEFMSQLMENYNDGLPFSETRCKILIYQMLLRIGDYVYRTKMRQSEENPLSAENWNRMREACAYIESHYTEELSQEKVAASIGLSVFYFSRLFRRYVNCSFPQYIAHVRVRAAAALLGRSDLPVTECAGLAGFQSITSFNKSFLQDLGVSPRDYRKMYRK